ncbi:FeoB-associated Cys-rich membrane protein [Desulfosarcina cetonica]|uniref:FeoB-associated Cys-rich membrane protein n=1 Tax=Desulfosarcina cetonica TaxID=90730 RepID=UPI0009FA6B12
MQTLIVILIVAGAAVYLGWLFYRRFIQKTTCACGCSGCQAADSCSSPPAPQRDGMRE